MGGIIFSTGNLGGCFWGPQMVSCKSKAGPFRAPLPGLAPAPFQGEQPHPEVVHSVVAALMRNCFLEHIRKHRIAPPLLEVPENRKLRAWASGVH